MRQGQEQAGEKFAAPRKPAFCERLVTETLEQRNEPALVLQDLPLSSAPKRIKSLRRTALPSLSPRLDIRHHRLTKGLT